MKAFPEALEVRGSQPANVKEERLRAFSLGEVARLITKPELAGFGLNWQHCAQAVFVGVSFSFERTYQALGRFHRFGQQRPVHIHLIYSETEGNVRQLLKEKQDAFAMMQTEMNAAMTEHGLFRENAAPVYTPTEQNRAAGKHWTMYLGDCVEVMATLPADSIDLTVTSIPFSNLYVYSDKQADVGNAANKAEFFEHMAYVIDELYRITTPGRVCAVHVKDLPLFINRDGAQGIDPLSDDVTTAFRRAGWVLQSRITVGKDPVIEMQKTNSHGLLYRNWKQTAEVLRVGMPDYILVFRKFALEGGTPVTHDPDDRTYFGSNPPGAGDWLTAPSRGSGANNLSLPVWQRYANPIWDDVSIPAIWADINQTNVLNYLVAKDDKDERHICPLQLDLISRLVHWYTNEGETVLDPFGGIGSTGYEALKLKRQFIGIELKESYYSLALKYLTAAALEAGQMTLFDWADRQEAVGK
jgi:DNA modification methylase